MKKRIYISIVLVLTLGLMLCACGSEPNANTNTEVNTDAGTNTHEQDQMEVVEIAITPENLEDYFLFSTEMTPHYNDYNEVEEYRYTTRLSLKDEYLEIYAYSYPKPSNVFVEFSYNETEQPYKITDPTSGSFEYIEEKVSSSETYTSTLTWEHPNLPTPSVSSPNSFTYEGDCIIYGKENIEVTHVEGYLYLYQ